MKVENAYLADEMYYNGEAVLSYKINYPEFTNDQPHKYLKALNAFYKENAETFEEYCQDVLYTQAIQQYEEMKTHGYPFHPYEVVVDYHVSFMSPQFMSVYFDTYIYTGGAHGSTMRHSDTWNLETGKTMEIGQYFPNNSNYKSEIPSYIIYSISDRIEEGNYREKYFETYEEDVKNTWNEENFYLTDQGIIVYFQQYDIGPYVSGILEFLIPFKD